jgi:hypothetical protein
MVKIHRLFYLITPKNIDPHSIKNVLFVQYFPIRVEKMCQASTFRSHISAQTENTTLVMYAFHAEGLPYLKPFLPHLLTCQCHSQPFL